MTEQKLAALGPAATMDALAWDTADFVAIARAQAAREAAMARAGAPVLICDTDAFATAIWHERYRGAPAAAVSRAV